MKSPESLFASFLAEHDAVGAADFGTRGSAFPEHEVELRKLFKADRELIARGGGWAYADEFVRCAVRDSPSPTEQANVLGVRPARLIVP